jgi:hypothetical protein
VAKDDKLFFVILDLEAEVHTAAQSQLKALLSPTTINNVLGKVTKAFAIPPPPALPPTQP